MFDINVHMLKKYVILCIMEEGQGPRNNFLCIVWLGLKVK